MNRWGSSTRRRLRLLVTVAALVALTVGMLVTGYFVPTGYPHELLVNMGAGIGMVVATYIVFDPLIRELQKPDVKVHPRLSFPEFFRNIRQVKSKETVAILETGTAALEDRHRRDFSDAIAVAFRRRALVRILLLDPDSVAASQRTDELAGKLDLRQQVMDNIRHLVDINSTVDGARELLHVRLYTITPAVSMHRWGDKAFVSFYPVGRLSYETEQLEVHLESSWGKFVVDRFTELWEDKGTRDVTHYLTLQVEVWYEGRSHRELSLRYVWHDDAYYVWAGDFGDALIGRDSRLIELRTEQLPLRAGAEAFGRLRLERVPAKTESATADAVAELFERKHGLATRDVVRLLPSALDQ